MDFRQAVGEWLKYVNQFSENAEKVHAIIEDINRDFDGNKHRIRDESALHALDTIPWRGNPTGVSPTQHGHIIFPELGNYPGYVKKFITKTSGRGRNPFLLMVTESCMYDKLIRNDLDNGLYSNPYLLKNYGVVAPSPIPESYSDVKAIKDTTDSWYIINETVSNLVDDVDVLRRRIEEHLKSGAEDFSGSFRNVMVALNYIQEGQQTDILVELYLQIAWCLAFFDVNGIMHGDLHSGNVIIRSNHDKKTFLLYVDPVETFISITPRFYPIFYDYDRSFWDPLRQDTINSPGKCGFSKKELPDRWWRIDGSETNSHKFISGYDMARLLVTAVPTPYTSRLTSTLAKAVFKDYDPAKSILRYAKRYRDPSKIHDMYSCFKEILTNIRKSYSNADPRYSIKYFKDNKIPEIKSMKVDAVRIGILTPSPLAVERMFERIDPSLLSLFNTPPAAPPTPTPGDYPYVYCRDLIDAFNSGADKIKNPISGRMVKRVDARGRPNKIIEPLLQGCGFNAPVPTPKRRQRRSKSKLVKAKKSGKITLTRAACGEFRREWVKKANTAINPLTGRKITLFTKTGASTARAKKVLEECQNKFS